MRWDEPCTNSEYRERTDSAGRHNISSRHVRLLAFNEHGLQESLWTCLWPSYSNFERERAGKGPHSFGIIFLVLAGFGDIFTSPSHIPIHQNHYYYLFYVIRGTKQRTLAFVFWKQLKWNLLPRFITVFVAVWLLELVGFERNWRGFATKTWDKYDFQLRIPNVQDLMFEKYWLFVLDHYCLGFQFSL